MIRRWLYSRKGERERGIRQIGTHIFLSQKFSSFFPDCLPFNGRRRGVLRSMRRKRRRGRGSLKEREREGGDWGRIGIGKGGGGETVYAPSLRDPKTQKQRYECSQKGYNVSQLLFSLKYD